MENNNKKYALITGASSGIGYELTKLFALDGYNLVLVGRSKDRLDEIARDWTAKYGVEVTVIEKNLFDVNGAQEVYKEVIGKGIQIDALVNDAGQGIYGFFAETELQSELNIIQLNVVSLLTLTKLFMRDMIARKKGRILNLASMVSKLPSPLMAVYAATKAFVYSFSESLVNELQDTGVTVTALMPGATATDFFHKAGAQNTIEYQDSELSDPEVVARDGYTAMMAGDARVISGMKNKFQAILSNFIPDSTLTENMRKQMNEKEDVVIKDENRDEDKNDYNKDDKDKEDNKDKKEGQTIANIQIIAQASGNAEIKVQQAGEQSTPARQKGDTGEPKDVVQPMPEEHEEQLLLAAGHTTNNDDGNDNGRSQGSISWNAAMQEDLDKDKDSNNDNQRHAE